MYRRNFLLFCLISTASSFSQNINRLGKFVKLSLSQTGYLKIRQIEFGTKIRCNQLCFHTRSCLSITFIAHVCTLYSYDPRINIEANLESDVSTQKSSLYGMSQAEDKMACFVDQSEVSNRAEIGQKCDLGEKIIDSRCSDWSLWTVTYDDQICNGTKLFSVKNRTRICSRGLNGGLQCSGNNFEEQQKVPVLFHSGEKILNYSDSLEYCASRGFSLFTNIALITADYSPFVSQKNLEKLRDWYYFLDAELTEGNILILKNDGIAEEYFAFCPSLDVLMG